MYFFKRNLISTARLFLLLLFLQITITAASQDTLKVAVYNLLYYGLETSYCNNTNNNLENKETYLRKIIKHIKPSILAVNEIAASTAMCDRFLSNVMNTEGVNYYNRVSYFNVSNSEVVNMLYYDSRKLGYHSHKLLSSYVRDVNMFKLYHKSPDLSTSHDTAFIYCIVAHLKAGNTENDLYARKMMTLYAMNNLNSFNINDNILIMGDFNTKTYQEECFQNLINHSNTNIRFNDPVDQLGSWYGNSTFKKYHTQSTNVSSNDCASGGGLDDRFDFILINDNVKNDNLDVYYIPDSYGAIGQDGLRFNQSINNPSNTLVPSDVAYALLKASDHLPVSLELRVNRLPANTVTLPDNVIELTSFSYHQNQLEMEFNSLQNESLIISCHGINGQLLFQLDAEIIQGTNTVSFDNISLQKGFYLLNIQGQHGHFNRSVKLPVLGN
ncbi:MAG: hypothetical protein PHT69_12825 [Bacteroidales bacterium]|nr:hypothetical protein [Bacteroidales bacterium]